jgi:hypothetical protein
MAKPLVNAETWRAIKLASISGVPDLKLAEYYGVTTGAISSRRFDDDEWRAAKPSLVKPLTGPPKKQTLASNPETISEVRSESLAEIGEQNSLLLARYVGQKIKNSVDADLLPDPEDWSQIKTASEILRKATGQDRDQPAVSVNLFASSQFYDDASPVFDAAVIETDPENTPDFC